MPVNKERLFFCLDTPDPVPVNPREFFLKGWIFQHSKFRNEVPRLKLIVDGSELPVTQGCGRSDVGEHLGYPGSDQCGFFALFDRPKWDPNVKLIGQIDSEERTLAAMTVPLARDKRNSSNGEPRITSYLDWIVHVEESLFWPDDEIADRIAGLARCPLISIIVPVFNTNPLFLERCIESVLKQRYANWQLCITDDASRDSTILSYLEKVAAADERIVFRRSPQNGGISRASNLSLESAKGEFIVLLDHDDELHPFALLEVVRRLNEVHDCALIYSDEDKIDDFRRRSQPAFKPDFDLDMFRAFDYLGHLVALRRDIVDRIGGFRPSSDGAQDWDLLLRAVEVAGPAAVSHIPKPLYHWRIHDDSTSTNLLSKPYVRNAWIHVLSEHLSRVDDAATVEPGVYFGTMRVKYGKQDQNRIAAFIRMEDGDYQSALIETLLEPEPNSLYQIADCVVRRLPSEGQSSANDIGPCMSSLSEIDGDIFIFINRPLETLNHAFFDELARQAARSDCGLVTGVSLDRNGKVASSGFIGKASGELIDPFAGFKFLEPPYMWQLGVTRRVETISDFFFATHRRHLAAIGGLAAVCGTRMPQLVNKLIQNAGREGLGIIVTPYAVATFDDLFRDASQPAPLRQPGSRSVNINPNLELFSDFQMVMRGFF